MADKLRPTDRESIQKMIREQKEFARKQAQVDKGIGVLRSVHPPLKIPSESHPEAGPSGLSGSPKDLHPSGSRSEGKANAINWNYTEIKFEEGPYVILDEDGTATPAEAHTRQGHPDPVYPSVTFEKKPTIQVDMKITLEELLEVLHYEHVNGPTKEGAMLLFSYYLRTKETTVPGTWTSFGHNLKTDGTDRVTYRNLFVFEEKRITAPNKLAGHQYSGANIPGFVCLYSGINHYGRLSGKLLETYRKDRINLIRTSVGVFGVEIPNWFGTDYAWSKDPGYEKLMSAIDMLLHKATDDPDSVIRTATVHEFGRDIAMADEYSMFKGFFNDSNKAFTYIWVASCRKELKRILKPHQEIHILDSYAQYLAAFQLPGTSPYSARLNPNCHFLFHSVGASLGGMRSINARHIGNISQSDIITNSCWISWKLRNGADFKILFATEARMDELIRLNGYEDRSLTNMTEEEFIDCCGKAKNGWELKVNVVDKYRWNMPKKVREYSCHRWADAKDVRAGTVGYILWRHARSELHIQDDRVEHQAEGLSNI